MSVFRGQIVGPNGIDYYSQKEWEMPPQFRGWCHVCGREPYNKVTVIKDEKNNDVSIPGMGFKTLDDLIKHKNYFHDYRKVRTL